MDTDTDPFPEVPGTMTELGPSREHIAYMRGYATALQMAAPKVHAAQIAQIRREYGYGKGDPR